MKSFDAEAQSAILDLTGDDDVTNRAKKNVMRWDAKKKKYVKDEDQQNTRKKIKTESGVWIPASYKSDRYSRWKERSKIEQENEEVEAKQQGLRGHPAMKKAKESVPKHKKGPKRELKRPEEVLKQRKLKEKQQMKNARKKKGKGRKR